MKGIIYVTSPKDFFKGDEIDIPSGEPWWKDLELTGEQGEKLEGIVGYSATQGTLDCLIAPEGKWNANMIAFWFFKIPRPGQIFKRRGQNFNTGKFVPWMCHFKRTGD